MEVGEGGLHLNAPIGAIADKAFGFWTYYAGCSLNIAFFLKMM